MISSEFVVPITLTFQTDNWGGVTPPQLSIVKPIRWYLYGFSGCYSDSKKTTLLQNRDSGLIYCEGYVMWWVWLMTSCDLGL